MPEADERDLEEFYREGLKRPPDPPPAPKPVIRRSRWVKPPWRGRGMHVAWGFAVGQYQPEQLAEKLANCHYEWAALEGYPATPGGLDNTPFHGPFKEALHSFGLGYMVWERTDQVNFAHVKQMIEATGPDGYLADVEVDWGRPENTTIPVAFAQTFPDLPRAVLIAGMPDAKYCKPWIDADFDNMVQAYSGPLHADPAVGIAGACDNDAYWRGWPTVDVPVPERWGGHDDRPHVWPVLEINSDGSAPLKTQLPAVAPWGENYSVYCVELMTDDDWAA